MNWKKLIAFSCLVVSSCAGKEEGKVQPVVYAVNASVKYANEDGVDLANYSLSSIRLFANGMTDVVEQGADDQMSVDLIKNLKGKRYWQACYTHVDPLTAGATFCYFIDSRDRSLVGVYRMK
jgi:hypothetical protein